MSSQALPERLFDEPGLSRQWVLRRLERALTLDLAAAAFQRGLAATARRERQRLSELGSAAQERADALRSLIVDLGSAPYSSVGLARACCTLGGQALGLVGRWAWRPAVVRLAEHTYSEYDLLQAYVDHAPGVPANLVDRVTPLLGSARTGHRSLSG